MSYFCFNRRNRNIDFVSLILTAASVLVGAVLYFNGIAYGGTLLTLGFVTIIMPIVAWVLGKPNIGPYRSLFFLLYYVGLKFYDNGNDNLMYTVPKYPLFNQGPKLRLRPLSCSPPRRRVANKIKKNRRKTV